MKRRHIVGATSSLLAAALLCGCTASEPEPPQELVSALGSLSALPGDIAAARTILREECLRDAGYPVPSSAVSTMTSRAQYGSIVGIWSSEEQARSSGYSTTYLPDVQHPLDEFAASLSDAEADDFYKVLRGDGTSEAEYTTSNGATFSRSATGCEAESDEVIFGNLDKAMEAELFVNEVNAAMSGKVDSIAVENEVATYERCMAERGYEVEGLHAEALAATQFGQYREYGEAPSLEERNLAVTDHRCQAESGLAEAVQRASARAIGGWLIEHESQILELRELIDDSVQKAQGIIHGSN